MKKITIIAFPLLLVGLMAFSLLACKKQKTSNTEGKTIAVFVPGVLEGSPTYEMMDQGVRKAATAANVSVKTLEGGFDQASWEDQLMVLASEGIYDLIVTSNPAMPEISRKVLTVFPQQEFLVLDGPGIPNDTITTVRYDHQEQAFLIGYFAGLATTETELKGINPERKVGLIVGQDYPLMAQEIRPGFEMGLKTAHPNSTLEFRVLGNWYDAEKARELAIGLYKQGVDLILTIAGGANQGVVAAANSLGLYVLWFDSDAREQAPETILASAVIYQDKAAEEMTTAWLKGEIKTGDSFFLNLARGYVDFTNHSSYYNQFVPENLRKKMDAFLKRVRDGSLVVSSIPVSE